MTDPGDVLQALLPALVSVVIVVGIALRSGRQHKRRR
jgi:hypothetical protein